MNYNYKGNKTMAILCFVMAIGFFALGLVEGQMWSVIALCFFTAAIYYIVAMRRCLKVEKDEIKKELNSDTIKDSTKE
ncbi:MAG: hypothetical protein RR646_05050 [Erysipelotrichaceae bacterium]